MNGTEVATTNDTDLEVVERSVEIFRSGGAIMRKNHDRSLKADSVGKSILLAIEKNGGKLNPELDARVNNFLANCAKALPEMQDERKAVTGIMDRIKSMYIEDEARLDVKKGGTVAFILQQRRNDYARQVAEETEQKRLAAEKQQRKEAEAAELKSKIEIQLSNYFNAHLLEKKQKMNNTFESITLEVYEARVKQLTEMIVAYSYEHYKSFLPAVTAIFNSPGDIKTITLNVTADKFDLFAAQYKTEVLELKQYLVDRMPAKKAELEAIAKANDDERNRLQKEADDRKKEQDEKLKLQSDESRLKAEQESELNKQQDLTMSLFNKEASMATDTTAPEARQGYDIELTHQAGAVTIFSFWFEREGKNLPLDKIRKTSIDQMITFCEKWAHKNNEKIDSKFIKYTPSYKAVNRKSK